MVNNASYNLKVNDDVFDVEWELDTTDHVAKKVFYPKTIEETYSVLVHLSQHNEQGSEYCSVYPLISVKRADDIVKTAVINRIIPPNLVHISDNLHYFYQNTKSTLDLIGPSCIRVEEPSFPVPKESLLNIIDYISTSTEFKSILDVHYDIASTLVQFYSKTDIPFPISRNHVITPEDVFRSWYIFDSAKDMGVGSFLYLYIALVTTFCLKNPLMCNSEFLYSENMGLQLLTGNSYFFKEKILNQPMMSLDYPTGDDHYKQMSRGFAVNNLVRLLKTDSSISKPFFLINASYILNKDYFESKKGAIFEIIMYDNREYVLCRDMKTYELLIDFVEKYRSGRPAELCCPRLDKAMEKYGVMFADTPELRHIYRIQVLKQGVSNHLDLKLGGL